MSRVAVTRVIDAPVGVVWEVFADLPRRVSPLSLVESVELLTPGPITTGTRWRETRTDATGRTVTEDLVITSVEPGRSCTMALAETDEPNELNYVFAPVDVGPRRGGTTVTAVAQRRPHGLANRLLSFLVGGFAARTAEGALRDELATLEALSRARITDRHALGTSVAGNGAAA